jgi:hypothetical protein
MKHAMRICISFISLLGCCECGDDPLDSIKGRNFLDCHLLKKDSAPWS